MIYKATTAPKTPITTAPIATEPLAAAPVVVVVAPAAVVAPRVVVPVPVDVGVCDSLGTSLAFPLLVGDGVVAAFVVLPVGKVDGTVTPVGKSVPSGDGEGAFVMISLNCEYTLLTPPDSCSTEITDDRYLAFVRLGYLLVAASPRIAVDTNAAPTQYSCTHSSVSSQHMKPQRREELQEPKLAADARLAKRRMARGRMLEYIVDGEEEGKERGWYKREGGCEELFSAAAGLQVQQSVWLVQRGIGCITHATRQT